jgi:hypothetical protein
MMVVDPTGRLDVSSAQVVATQGAASRQSSSFFPVRWRLNAACDTQARQWPAPAGVRAVTSGDAIAEVGSLRRQARFHLSVHSTLEERT